MAEFEVAQATQLLEEWRAGDGRSQDRLIQLFYPWLRQAASGMLVSERQVSLSPGDLVHETALRLIKSESNDWRDRAHFLAVASTAMRRVLIDHVRAKQANKRRHHRVTLVTNLQEHPQADMRALHHALLRLAAIDEVKANIVEMRYFGGMSIADIAEVTELSDATVKRRWAAARAWLLDALEQDV
ncbi:MAG: ECF-type sigma factor [Parasphingopyxis sp.]|nr:sigma-70 family RNA polymerase sigma factor [Sphingomonadales bacterium]